MTSVISGPVPGARTGRQKNAPDRREESQRQATANAAAGDRHHHISQLHTAVAAPVSRNESRHLLKIKNPKWLSKRLPRDSYSW